MLPDRVSKPGPLTYESGALPIALRSPAFEGVIQKLSLLLFLSGALEFADIQSIH